MVLWAVVLSVVLASAGLVVVLSSRNAWRWGEIAIRPARVGEGAYRDVEVARTIPRGTPRRIQWAAGTGFVWAVVTFFAFAPAGLLFALVLGDGPRTALIPMPLLVVCLSGFALAVFLVVVGISLLRGRPRAGERARVAAIWSWIHHAAVFVLFALIAFSLGEEWPFLVAIPCVIGAAQAALAFAASRAPAPVVINEGPRSAEPL